MGDKPRWGTLGMKATAPASTRWYEGWPRGLYRPSVPTQLMAMAALAAAVAAAMVLLSVSTLAETQTVAATTAVAVPVVLASLHALSQWTPSPRAFQYSGAGQPLLARLREADMRTTHASLSEGFAVVASDIRPHGDRALFALPDSAVSWSLSLSEPTSLDTAAALRQEAWTRPGDGVTFTVSVTVDGRSDVLWTRHIDPFADQGARRWHDVTVRLDRYVGKTVTLTLATQSGPNGNAVLDAAMWREPVLRRSVVR